MKIKDILACRLVEQVQTSQGVETIIELDFLAAGETHTQKIFIFQDNQSIVERKFELHIREYLDA
ncbi:hypothetical protein LCGC14_2585560 [marine sediment metagenome]|uniref:Uncharacterized protein n=1 Tax=marine sediment metagenome TaxID=412755 RepID=A0A0F9D5Y3_9ZZZZ